MKVEEIINNIDKNLLTPDLKKYPFTRANYEKTFESYYKQIKGSLALLEEEAKENADVGQEFGREVFEIYYSNLRNETGEEESFFKKQKRNDIIFKYSLFAVAFMIPSFFYYRRSIADDAAYSFIDNYNEKFPDRKITPATFEQINSGFNKKLCFITTAVCQNLNKSNDCYELNTLRAFRDDFFIRQYGEEMIEEYYFIAPFIVSAIEASEDRNQIYDQINENYICPCVKLIEKGEFENCAALYREMVYELSEII